MREHGVMELAPRLRRRARLLRLRAHAADVPRIENEPGLVLSGASAAVEYDLDVRAPGSVEAYARPKLAKQLIRRYQLEPSNDPNVFLRVIEGIWPFGKNRYASLPVAAMDLLDADDERSRRAGRKALSHSGSF